MKATIQVDGRAARAVAVAALKAAGLTGKLLYYSATRKAWDAGLPVAQVRASYDGELTQEEGGRLAAELKLAAEAAGYGTSFAAGVDYYLD